MVQSRRSRRNPFIRHIQRHARVSALDAATLATTGKPATTPLPDRAALGVAGGSVPIELQQGLGPGRLPVASATSSPSTTQPAWNQTGRTPVPVVMARLVPTPAPWEGGDELVMEEPAAAAAGGEESQAAEMGWEPPERVQQSQAGRLPSNGFAEQPHAEMGTLYRSAQKPPELAVQKPAQKAALPSKPQEEASSSERGNVQKQADAGSLSPQEDGVWKRLQTIFRKHEEKRHEAEASADTRSSRTAAGAGVVEPGEEEQEKIEDGAPMSAAGAPEQAAAMDEDKAGAASTPGPQEPWMGDMPGDRVTAGESLSESASPNQGSSKEELTPLEPGEGEQQTSLAQGQSVQAESVTDRTNAAVPSRPPVMTKPEPGETLAARTESPRTPVSIPSADAAERTIEGIPSDEFVPGDSIEKKPVEPQPQELPSQALQIDDQKSQTIQPLPLEDVWPVQRQTSPLAQEGEQAAFADEAQEENADYILDDVISVNDEHIKTSENTAASLEILGQEEHAQVREALREVSPGKPTDSSVEIITPRRQRPAREKDLGIEPAEKAAPGAHGPTQSTVEALPAFNAPGKEKPGMDFEKASEEVFTASEAVETEIGPLPVDLWELIGESPQAAQPRPMQTASPATIGQPVQRESLAPQNGKKMPEAPTGFIQKQPEGLGAAGDQPVAAAAAEPQAEIDMDELARRVYGEVKRRLALEWERMRRRL